MYKRIDTLGKQLKHESRCKQFFFLDEMPMRWTGSLTQFNFKVNYNSSKVNHNAYTLSRYPLNTRGLNVKRVYKFRTY